MNQYKSSEFTLTNLFIELPYNGEYLAKYRHESGHEIEILFDSNGRPIKELNENTSFIKQNLGLPEKEVKILPILIDNLKHIAVLLPKQDNI